MTGMIFKVLVQPAPSVILKVIKFVELWSSFLCKTLQNRLDRRGFSLHLCELGFNSLERIPDGRGRNRE